MLGTVPPQAWLPAAKPSAIYSTNAYNSISTAIASEPGCSEADVVEYVLQGPLLSSCGLTPAGVQQNGAEWERLGRQLATQLGFDPANLDSIARLRIYHYYLPVFFWAQQQLTAHKSTSNSPLVLGISAPQGCGKSTLVEQLEQLFTWLGCKAASVSVDDFYLTYEDQTALAAANPDNQLLQYRGNAGTHDLKLGSDTLAQLKGLTSQGQSVPVPRYDKSAHQGRGDRAPVSSWPCVAGPLDIVLFEGWMSGFRPLPEQEAMAVHPGLSEVNKHLQHYDAAWDSWVDAWLVIRIGDPQWVFKWRLQAEDKMKESGKPGMTDKQVADFVARFQPAYKAYLPSLYSQGPTTAKAGKTLIIEVDANRSPVQEQPRPVV